MKRMSHQNIHENGHEIFQTKSRSNTFTLFLSLDLLLLQEGMFGITS